LALGMRLPGTAEAEDQMPGPDGDFEPNAFIRIDLNGSITLVMPQTEIGQGVYTGSAMLMCEELEVGLDQIQIQAAPPDMAKYANPILHNQATGGSTSTRAFWTPMRQAGAAARMMLVNAAANKWSVDPETCRAERGVVYHDASHRTIAYGEIAADAAVQPVPKKISLKDSSRFKLLGTNARRLDTPSKLNGTAKYSIDVIVPGLRVGTLAMTPVKGGKIASMDEAAARATLGVRDVVRVGGDVAVVVGDHMWAAKRGLEALNIVWDAGSNADVTSAALTDAIAESSLGKAVVAKREGDALLAIDGAATKVSRVYELPYLSHSAMEPLSCTVHVQSDRAEVWGGSQVLARAQKAVADATGLPISKVIVHNMLMGGAFGRRLDIDFFTIAALVAKQVGYPVKLVWTREEDLRHDYYRPYYHNRVSAGLDAAGKVVARTHRVTGPSIFARIAPARFVNGLDPDAVECAAETPYDKSIPAALVEYVRHEPKGMNTGFWRGVGDTANVFVVESFIDELAGVAKHDPVTFRRDLLKKNPRALAVLELAAEKANWGASLPSKMGRGIGVQFAFGSYASCVMEVEVPSLQTILVRRAVIAVDCGSVVNPDTVRAQIEGGLIFGLSAALFNEITVTNGAVDQSNFHDYRVLRIDEAPKIEVYRIHSNEAPGGIGEVGTAAAAPALGNAIFAATGIRLRRMPFARELEAAATRNASTG
jgi:isoquinoline 1-oxidoreductase subunit beta